MPDKPMISKSALRTGEGGADVLHEALAMRQEAERALAEAGERRSIALSEATQVLDQARAAAATLAEEAASEAQQIVQQAREQALGIVARAREDAEQVLADAHADAAEFDAWARRDAQDSIRGEVTAAREALETRRAEVDVRLAALRAALDDAVDALEETTRLPSLFLETTVDPVDAGRPVHDLGVRGDAASTPPARMTLVTTPPLDVDVDDDPDHGSAAPDGDDRSDSAESSDHGDDRIDADDRDRAADADTDTDTDSADDLDAFDHAASFAGSSSLGATLVRARTEGTAQSTDDDAATTVDGVGDADTITIDREHDEDQRPYDDAARPLGWLFRSPPM